MPAGYNGLYQVLCLDSKDGGSTMKVMDKVTFTLLCLDSKDGGSTMYPARII